MSFMSGIMMGATIGRSINEFIGGKGKGKSGSLGGLDFLGNMGSGRGKGSNLGNFDFFSKKGSGRGKKSDFDFSSVFGSRKVEEFVLVSALPGRRRYRIRSLIKNEPLAEMLEKKLTQIKGVSDVKVNTLTGSLLILYNCDEATMDACAEKLRKLIVPVNAADTDVHGGNEQSQGQKPVATYFENWKNMFSMINSQIYKVSRGWFDFSSLLSLVFLIRGLRKMLVYGQRPSGPTMVWWAIHLMKGWRG
ncbi:MAG: hypothetical protein K6C05_08870 [Anaerovibrio sp.]|uniref:HMA2 domain-containing protein n=1 Tax=Anaerovibrio sp. TaxID=1872532 RepID=UPI0025ECAFFE|nr:hypothetical protein [Anaerovibrio sp.]MCR5176943.1 hypothetical protein [Anaerovibrio sp.]